MKINLRSAACVFGTFMVASALSLAAFYPAESRDADTATIRIKLESRLEKSKDIFSPAARDRVLSDLINESMEARYYDIARHATNHISMPMVRSEMLKKVVYHCMQNGGARCMKK